MKYIRIYIIVCIKQKVYECRVSARSTFTQIIWLLEQMIHEDIGKEYTMKNDFEIFELFTHMRCNKEISLESLDVQDGMWFQLY